MDIELIKDNLEEEDFLIRVRPFANDSGRWSGDIDLSVMSFPENQMSDEDYSQVLHFCKMMCASVPIMEEVEDIRNIVHDYVMNELDYELDVAVQLEAEEDKEEAGVEKTYDGNVVHLSFNTKTGGNA